MLEWQGLALRVLVKRGWEWKVLKCLRRGEVAGVGVEVVWSRGVLKWHWVGEAGVGGPGISAGTVRKAGMA